MLHAFSLVDEDDDSNNCTLLRYELVNNTGGVFVVSSGPPSSSESSQAVLSLARPLDYETLPRYHMTLIVRDRGSPSRSSVAVIDVHVTDVVDNLPRFSQSLYSVSVVENDSNRTILQLVASSEGSPPHSGVHYVITHGDAEVFQVHSSTGLLTVRRPLDYETAPLYELTVRAQLVGNSQLVANATVVVTVLDVNDHTPVFSRMAYQVSVSKTAAVGSHVTLLRAEDGDSGEGGMVRYSISPDTDSIVMELFRLDSATGAISVLMPLSLLSRDTYFFSVEARDGGDPVLIGNTNVTILVSGVTNERPVFEQSEYVFEIEEGEHLVFMRQLNVTDTDTAEGNLSYFIHSGNGEGLFVIEGGGVIVTRGPWTERERTTISFWWSFQMEWRRLTQPFP